MCFLIQSLLLQITQSCTCAYNFINMMEHSFIHILKVFEQVAGDIPNLSATSSFKSPNLSLITVKRNPALYFKDDRVTVCRTFF